MPKTRRRAHVVGTEANDGALAARFSVRDADETEQVRLDREAPRLATLGCPDDLAAHRLGHAEDAVREIHVAPVPAGGAQLAVGHVGVDRDRAAVHARAVRARHQREGLGGAEELPCLARAAFAALDTERGVVLWRG
jgi:hypothetical protein